MIISQSSANQRHGMARRGFSLIEILVVVSLLTVIMLGLLMMFNQTSRAFRNGMTQTDVLESGRALTSLLSSELEQIAPSQTGTNFFEENVLNASFTNSLPGGNSQFRTNVLETFYFLTRNGQQWNGRGYLVALNPPDINSGYGSLYRYAASCPVGQDPTSLYDSFISIMHGVIFNSYPPTNASLSRVMDGVVHFSIKAYDTNGVLLITNQMTYIKAGYLATDPGPAAGLLPVAGQVVYYTFTTNAVPAAVEFELGVLEDHTLAQLQAIPDPVFRTKRLESVGAAATHLFRQRVYMHNVDISAYQ